MKLMRTFFITLTLPKIPLNYDLDKPNLWDKPQTPNLTFLNFSIEIEQAWRVINYLHKLSGVDKLAS